MVCVLQEQGRNSAVLLLMLSEARFGDLRSVASDLIVLKSEGKMCILDSYSL
jgi:hypothetical protein